MARSDFRSIPSADELARRNPQIASKYIQIWPVADASISGISQNQRIRFKLPQLTLTLNDLYPDSKTYAQVYRGEPQLGHERDTGSGNLTGLNESVSIDRVLVLNDYESVFDGDGRWTMEVLTITPFGIDRLAYVTFRDRPHPRPARGTISPRWSESGRSGGIVFGIWSVSDEWATRSR